MPSEAAACTRLLRSSEDAMWRDLRALLRSRNVDVRRSALAFSVEQGDDSEFGVLVTHRGEVFTFAWQPSTGLLYEWVSITGSWRDSPYRDDIPAALELAKSEKPA